MRILVACECSGTVREAFRARGHDAWSCDILPAVDGSPFHLQGDVLFALKEGNGFYFKALKKHTRWDMMIAHPPCDFLTNSAAWAYADPNFEKYPGVGYHQQVKRGTLTGACRRDAREKAVEFFLSLWNCGIKRVCLENPIGFMNTLPAMGGIRPQIIQPYEFGDDASKATCLWLKGLPPLRPTKRLPGRIVEWKGKKVERWSNQTDSGQNNLTPSGNRAGVRAVTYPGIAQAMADQWPSPAL